MTIDAPIHTNEANLPRVLNAGAPAVLVFWKRGSALCDRLMPVLDGVAKQYAGKALVVKVNVTDEPGLTHRYSIAQLPTLVFTRDGQELARGTGAVNEPEVTAWVEYLIAGGARPPLIAGPSEPLTGAASTATSTSARPEGDKSPATQPLVISDSNFAQVIREATAPVLVDFWAEWCGPCKMIAPHVAALAQEFAGRALIAKMNVDENPRTAGQYGIMSIPTLLIFSEGRVVDQIVGAQPAQVLRQRLARFVKN